MIEDTISKVQSAKGKVQRGTFYFLFFIFQEKSEIPIMETVAKKIAFFLLGAVWLCPVWVFAGPNERASVAIYFGYEVDEDGDEHGIEIRGNIILGKAQKDTITATLYVHNATNLAGYDILLRYDPTKLELLSHRENGASSNVLYRDGGKTPSCSSGVYDDSTRIRFWGDKEGKRPSHAPDGHGVLGEMCFKVLEEDSTRIEFEMVVLEGLNVRGEKVRDVLVSRRVRRLHNDILDGVINGSVGKPKAPGTNLRYESLSDTSIVLKGFNQIEDDALPIFKFSNREITKEDWRYAHPLTYKDTVAVTNTQWTVRMQRLPSNLFCASYHFAMGMVDTSFSVVSAPSNSCPVIQTVKWGTNKRASLALYFDKDEKQNTREAVSEDDGVDVTLTAHNVHNLSGYSATIWYDSAKLSYTGWTQGETNIFRQGEPVFQITERTLRNLEEEVPDSVLKKLESIKNHKPIEKEKFRELLKQTIEDDLVQYQPSILEHARVWGDLWLPPVVHTDSTVTVTGILGHSTISDGGDLGELHFMVKESGETKIRFQEVVLQSVFYKNGTQWTGNDTLVRDGESIIHTDILNAAIGDTTRPNAITDLDTVASADTILVLTWTNPNQGTDEDAQCIFKTMQGQRIDKDNWYSADVLTHEDFVRENTPLASAEKCTLSTLRTWFKTSNDPANRRFFAVRLVDDAWNVSAVSNNAAVPPDSLWWTDSGVRALSWDIKEGWARHPVIHLRWGAAPDPTRDHYRIYRGGRLVVEVPDTATTWWDLTPNWDWSAEDTLFYEIAAVDTFGNEVARTERGQLVEVPPYTPEIESISSDYKTVAIWDKRNPPKKVEHILDVYRFDSESKERLTKDRDGSVQKDTTVREYTIALNKFEPQWGKMYVYALKARNKTTGLESGMAVGTFSSDSTERASLEEPPKPVENWRWEWVDTPGDGRRRIKVGWSLSPDDTSGSRDVGYYVLKRSDGKVVEIPRVSPSQFERLFPDPEDEILVRGYVDVDVEGVLDYKYTLEARDLFWEEPSEKLLVGDFDGGGSVGLNDFSLFVRKYGLSLGDEGYDPLYDLDGSDMIDLGDFSIFVRHYGEGEGSPGAVAKIGIKGQKPWTIEKEITKRNVSVCLLVHLSTSTSTSTCLPAGYQFVVEYDPHAWRVVRSCNGSGSTSPLFITKTVGEGRLLVAGMVSDGKAESSDSGGRTELARVVFASKEEKGKKEEKEDAFFALSDIQVIDAAMQIWRLSDVRTGDVLPETYKLSMNVPNPFNASTRLKAALPRTEILRLEVYDILGQRVRTIANGKREAGFHTFVWDGRDDAGNKVGSGVYLCRLEAGDFVAVRKMLLLK